MPETAHIPLHDPSVANYVSTAGSDIANLLLVTSAFACALATQNTASRYIYALAKDRVLPRHLGIANVKHGSPMAAAAASGATMLVLTIAISTVTSNATLAYSFLGGVCDYAMMGLWVITSLAVVRYFRKNPDEHFGLWHTTIAPLLSFVALGMIFGITTIHIDDLIGGEATVRNITLAGLLLIIAIGAALAAWFKRNRPEIYELIGSQR